MAARYPAAMVICTVCQEAVDSTDKTVACLNGHSFHAFGMAQSVLASSSSGWFCDMAVPLPILRVRGRGTKSSIDIPWENKLPARLNYEVMVSKIYYEVRANVPHRNIPGYLSLVVHLARIVRFTCH